MRVQRFIDDHFEVLHVTSTVMRNIRLRAAARIAAVKAYRVARDAENTERAPQGRGSNEATPCQHEECLIAREDQRLERGGCYVEDAIDRADCARKGE